MAQYQLEVCMITYGSCTLNIGAGIKKKFGCISEAVEDRIQEGGRAGLREQGAERSEHAHCLDRGSGVRLCYNMI